MLLTLAAVPVGLGGAVVGFLAFRLFDVVKPFPARRAEQAPRGGWGVMADDLVAGLYAQALLRPAPLAGGRLRHGAGSPSSIDVNAERPASGAARSRRPRSSAVGTELLTPFRSDTNSLFLTAGLNELGIVVRRKSIVGDDAEDLGCRRTLGARAGRSARDLRRARTRPGTT